MNSIIHWHAYLMLNGAIILGYMLTRLILSLPMFKKQLLQSHRLTFARYSFITVIATFLLGPQLFKLLPVNYDSSFTLEPIVKVASTSFMHSQQIVADQVSQMSSGWSIPSISMILSVCLFVGFAYYFGKLIHNIYQLKRINSHSFCRHQIKNVHVLFNHTTAVPYCWSFFNKHYVVIPSAYLEKIDDMKLAIRHELQHIRQLDTYWLHSLSFVKIICFWNPVMKLWINWFDELQEFSCDESLMLRKKTSAGAYAQCLVDAASDMLLGSKLPQGALGIHGFSTSILSRRVTMLFDYKPLKKKKLTLIAAYAVTMVMTATTSIAFAAATTLAPLSTHDVARLIEQSKLDKSFQVAVTPEVVSELNNIRGSEHARTYMQDSLQRMKQHQPLVEAALQERGMPNDLQAVALVESGFQPLKESENPVKAAGIWQIIPSTAQHLGLVINDKVDQRMDMRLATKAAITLLKNNYDLYHNWKLAFVAYEIGEKATDALIKETGSHDAWVLANSPKAPPGLKMTLARFDAELIIMHNTSIIDS